ncbi:RNA polymerase sigma factor [Deminuibacter soli]|uniref:Sigma-70 family RNA polymerase sigma factor n=1 Tax=Deminuibacter soli TaxID=2291815 RepID=A0A3E1NIR8_9BACT|nr:sigma-70 family RNA polymerase sigma factor [Deminuibacter soli]RFM27678.1 hypothetical protein DXN05_13305 [Deminuibacter soli]
MAAISNNDAQWWQDALNGDQQAFRLLFREYYPHLFTFGCKLTADKALLEDAIQELFTELWSNKHKSSIRSLRAYLFKALQYKLYKKLYNKKIIYPADDSVLDMPFAINRETLLVQAEEDKARAEKIAALLSQLSNRQREIVYLRFYKNMEYEEISEIMQINYQVARNLLSQAIKAMRKLMLVLSAIVCAI